MITVLKEKNTTRVIDLNIGDCFKYNGELYIKTPYYDDGIEANKINAVNLAEGTYTYIKSATSIEKINAEVREV